MVQTPTPSELPKARIIINWDDLENAFIAVRVINNVLNKEDKTQHLLNWQILVNITAPDPENKQSVRIELAHELDTTKNDRKRIATRLAILGAKTLEVVDANEPNE